MADPINCEGWDTGKPFLGVPSKFVVINEDGEQVGTLDELIPLLMLVSNNLSDIEDTVEARNNLGVYSKSEVDNKIDFIPYLPLAYPKSTPPTGYLAMMGQSISQATYPILYSLYGATLPDLRGLVIRGLDGGRGVDSDPWRAVLSQQGDAIQNITGAVSNLVAESVGVSGAFTVSNTGAAYAGGQGKQFYRIDFDASRVVRTAGETRVRNMVFLYIVKAG